MVRADPGVLSDLLRLSSSLMMLIGCAVANLNVRGCKTCEFSPTGSCEEPDAEEFEQLVKVWCDVLNVATCQRCLSGF
jgi:hypothetical protein